VSGQHATTVLHADRALDGRLAQIAEHRGDDQSQTDQHRRQHRQVRITRPDGAGCKYAAYGTRNSTLNGFARTDRQTQLVFSKGPAREIGADAFFILTDVPKVYINFNKPNQQALDIVSVAEAQKYFDAGEFAAGSMGPKVLAAIDFVRGGGKETIITDASSIGKKGMCTKIVAA